MLKDIHTHAHRIHEAEKQRNARREAVKAELRVFLENCLPENRAAIKAGIKAYEYLHDHDDFDHCIQCGEWESLQDAYCSRRTASDVFLCSNYCAEEYIAEETQNGVTKEQRELLEHSLGLR